MQESKGQAHDLELTNRFCLDKKKMVHGKTGDAETKQHTAVNVLAHHPKPQGCTYGVRNRTAATASLVPLWMVSRLPIPNPAIDATAPAKTPTAMTISRVNPKAIIGMKRARSHAASLKSALALHLQKQSTQRPTRAEISRTSKAQKQLVQARSPRPNRLRLSTRVYTTPPAASPPQPR